MPLYRTLLALLVCASVGLGAELRTLKGEVRKGEVKGITDKEVVFTADGKDVTTPVAEVLQIDFAPAGKLPTDAKWTDVELTDGTLLHCSAFALKGKQVELKLLAGPEVKLPLAAVANVLNDAQVEKYRKEWTSRLSKKRRHDVVAILRKSEASPEGVVNPLEGTLGDGDEDGKAIAFTLSAGGRKVSFALEKVHGLIFQRELDPKAPSVVCKVRDTVQDVVYASSVVSTPTGVTLTTPAGAKIEYKKDLLAQLDYSKGKLEFLSKMEPVKVVETSTEDQVYHYQRDVNLDRNGPLRIGGETFSNGLAIHSHTELEYDLKGEFRELKAVIGLDDNVGGHPGPVILRIEGDGKELFSRTLSRKEKDKSKEKVSLNIKDVQRLRIVVTSGELLDLGKHIDLADAQVSK
jgi:hypothetical protein